MSFSRAFLQDDIWQQSHDKDEPASVKRISLHYARARMMCRHSGLSIHDIQHLTKKFWDFHFDLIAARDMTAFIIATIHINLCIGTLSAFAKGRPDLADLLESLLRFDICGEFMLTEIGHGLDARNLETTATLLPDGSFDLHTPNEAAAKAMPPTTPHSGVPRVAIVFARLIAGGEGRGVKPFLVWLSDSRHMKHGITSRALPTRPGTKPLDHSITSFCHVRLRPKALLGSMSKPKDERGEFLRNIWRVSVGTLSLSIMGISAIRVGTHIAAAYSQRRMTASPDGQSRIPIMAFSTQQRPLIDGWVLGIVLDAYARRTTKAFTDPDLAPNVRHALAVVFKAAVIRSSSVLNSMLERCGWQGLFAFNQISELALTFQGNSIAEGDTLVLCIRLASELLGNKYTLLEAQDSSSLLAQHESDMWTQIRNKVSEVGGYEHHRSEGFNRHVLPRCRSLVEATGHRMAYEAARNSNVCPKILHLFERMCVGTDLGWYIENGHVTTKVFHDSLVDAYDAVLPDMLRSLDTARFDGYITAPIMTNESWNAFVRGLPSFRRPHGRRDRGYQPKL
ncbi:hypothetical protein B0T10DRAFT_582266 [Thelonectria olida]|uniref:Acyl-CoA oxidase n=1 Tax=Thelonectria olida TaxID=1576542 RepID=A0A9P8VVL4_9HYPO|nr:hypothetical protein B0T10DRAFT_582266 [Thelonectria olida]